MRKRASESRDHRTRTGSASTRPLALGRFLENLPADFDRSQLNEPAIQWKNAFEEMENLNAKILANERRLQRSLPYHDYRATKDRLRSLNERKHELHRALSLIEGTIRSIIRGSWTWFFHEEIKDALDLDVYEEIRARGMARYEAHKDIVRQITADRNALEDRYRILLDDQSGAERKNKREKERRKTRERTQKAAILKSSKPGG